MSTLLKWPMDLWVVRAKVMMSLVLVYAGTPTIFANFRTFIQLYFTIFHSYIAPLCCNSTSQLYVAPLFCSSTSHPYVTPLYRTKVSSRSMQQVQTISKVFLTQPSALLQPELI